MEKVNKASTSQNHNYFEYELSDIEASPNQLSPARSVHFSGDLKNADFDKQIVDILDARTHISLSILLLLILTMWPEILLGFFRSSYFTKPFNEYRCFVEALEKTEWTFDMIKNLITPKNVSNCFMYDADYENLVHLSYNEAKKSIEHQAPKLIKCNKFVYKYNKSYGVKKLYEAECSTYNWKKITGECTLLIRSFGYIISGIASDIYGRKIIMQVNVVLCLFLLFLTIFSPSLWFMTLLSSVSVGITYICGLLCYIIFIETIPGKMRPYMSQIFYAGAGFTLIGSPFLQIYVRHTLYLNAMYVTFGLVMLFGMWYIPESPRWLISQRRYQQLFDVFEHLDIDFPEYLRSYRITPNSRNTFRHQISILNRKRFRKRIFFSSYILLVVYITHSTGFKLVTSEEVKTSGYAILLGCFTLLRPLTCTALLYFLGRKLSICCLCLSVAAAYSFTLADGLEVSVLLFAAGLTVQTFSIAILYITELYPVVHSGTMLGFVCGLGTAFILLFIIIENLFVEAQIYQYVVKMVINLVGAVFVLFLPDTTSTILPLTDTDALNLKKHMRRANRRTNN